MGYTYTKLFSGLTESTVWVEPYATRVLWVSMLSWADQHGRVFGSIPGIARRAGVNMDECEAALVSFTLPDRHSRTPDHAGRRIEKIDGGWRLLNYAKYRAMRDAEARREYQREWVGEKRRQEKSTHIDSRQSRPGSTQAEAEAEAEREGDKSPPLAPEGAPPRQQRRGRKPPTPVPEEFDLTEPLLAWAKEHTGLDAGAIERETQKMLSHNRAHGSVMADWQAAWRTWMLRVNDFRKAG
jgi:hypothetical protein